MSDEECDLDTFMDLMNKYDDKEIDSDAHDAYSQIYSVQKEDDELLAQAAKEAEESNLQASTEASPAVASSAPSSAERELLVEMRKMQERIQMLESQLKAKQEPTPKPKKLLITQSAKVDTKVPSPNESKTAETKRKAFISASPDGNIGIENKISFAEAMRAATEKSDAKNDVKIKSAKEQERELFGDLDDEDSWEGLDGEKVSALTESGKELKRLLDVNKRIAHQPKHDSQTVKRPSAKPKTELLEKASSSYITSLIGIPNDPGITSSYTGDHCSLLRSSDTASSGNVVKEQYSGIRIINPLISHDQMTMLMDNRRMIKLSSLRHKLGGSELDGDWVTMGVLVSKSDQKISAKGQKYSIWKLSDLTDCDQTPVSMFLFRDVNTSHWKTMVGTVLGFLNPSIMSNKDEKYKSNPGELSLTVDNPKKILPLGISKDLGTCKGRTKAGNSCTNFINTAQGDHCSYHVQAAYKKQSAKRAELQNGFSGVVPKFKKEMDKLRNYGQPTTMSYKNDIFSTKQVQKRATKVSVESLISHQSQKDLSHRGYTDSLKKRNEINTLVLHDLLPSSGDPCKQSRPQPTVKGASTPHGSKDQLFHDLLMKPSVGSMNFVKHLKDSSGVSTTPSDPKKAAKVEEVTAEQLLEEMQKRFGQGPMLGRGVDKNGFISLNSSPNNLRGAREALANERAKLQALQKIQELGGLKRKDPNSTRVDRHDKSFQERIKKRLRESEETNFTEFSPPAKKSKLLANIDLNSSDVQKLINAKSAHEGLLTAEQEAKQEEYFNAHEKVEKMEEKMINTKEIKVDAIACPQCKYTALSASSLCISEGHKTMKVKAVKRFFRCVDCKHRCFSLDRMPLHPCSKCGGESFEKTGMMAEKKGPSMEAEKLLVRGEERKFVNSL